MSVDITNSKSYDESLDMYLNEERLYVSHYFSFALGLILFLNIPLALYLKQYLFLGLCIPYFVLSMISIYLTKIELSQRLANIVLYTVFCSFNLYIVLNTVLIGSNYGHEAGILLMGVFGFLLYNHFYSMKWTMLGVNFVLLIFIKIFHTYYPNGILEYPKHPAIVVIAQMSFYMAIGVMVVAFHGHTVKFNKYMKLQILEILKRKERVEKQIKELSIFKNNQMQFFTNIAYELRTPLTLLKGPAKILINDKKVNKEQKNLLTLIEKNSNQLIELTDAIIDLTKIETNEITIKKSTIHFSNFINDFFRHYKSIANYHGLSLHLNNQCDENLFIKVDNGKLFFILKTLICNALIYTPKSGVVTLNCSVKNNSLSLVIIDTGKGISQEKLKSIFNKYIDSKNGQYGRQTMSINLSICKEYSELLGGQVSAQSELGKGSQFTVSIPYETANEQTRALSTMTLIDIQPTNSTEEITINNHLSTIMVVESDENFINYLNIILSPSYKVISFKSSSLAIQYLSQAKQLPQLIISNAMSPNIDGFQFINFLKNEVDFNFIPIIMLTDTTDSSYKIKALRIGVDDYILKPFDKEELVARVETLITNAKERNKKIQPSKPKASISKEDMEWLENLEAVILKNLSNFNLTIDFISLEIAMSSPQIYRKTKEILGLTPTQYINQIRFQEARRMLEEKEYFSVKAVAYSVGFKAEKNFSKNFKKRFGKNPSEYLNT